MVLHLGERPVRRLTTDEVLDMVRAGILPADERVELLEGVLTAVSPQSDQHVAVIQRLLRHFAALLISEGHDLRVQMPLEVPDRTSYPEPDLAVVAREDDTIATPTTALLVVEVSCSSLRIDTAIKGPLYASAGITEYWVVDVEHRCVHVFGEPGPGGFGTRTRHTPPAALDCATVPGAAPLDLAALFTGL